MKTLIRLLGVASMVAGMSLVSAATVQGITWDTNSVAPPDFGANGTPMYQWFQGAAQGGAAFAPQLGAVAFNPGALGSLVGTHLTGAGVFANLNGTGPTVFAPGRELTFIFGGIEILTAAPSGAGAAFTFNLTNSFFRIYSDISNDYTIPLVTGLLSDQIKASNSDFVTPFLTGRFDSFDVLTSLLTTTSLSGFSDGLISFTGGAAFANFNTNTIANPAGGFADMTFSGSSQISAGSMISNRSSVDLVGQTIDIPEPGTLALVGLALAGMGVAARRRRAIA